MMKVFMLVWAVDNKTWEMCSTPFTRSCNKAKFKRIFMKFRKPINGWHFHMIWFRTLFWGDKIMTVYYLCFFDIGNIECIRMSDFFLQNLDVVFTSNNHNIVGSFVSWNKSIFFFSQSCSTWLFEMNWFHNV